MKQIIEFFSNIGTHVSQTQIKKKSIHLVNQASGIAISFSIVFLVTNLSSGSYDTIISSTLAVVLFSIVPLLNYRKKYKLAKKLLLSISLLATSVCVVVSELDSNMYYYFASVFASMLIFFPERENLRKILITNFSCMGLSMLISYSDIFPKLVFVNTLALGIMNILLLMLIIYALISTLMKESYLFEKKTGQLLQAIKEKNTIINHEKEIAITTAKVLTGTNADLHQEAIEHEKLEKSLRESNRTLQQFTYIASHDMKEPLRTIGSFSGLLKRRLGDKLGEREQEYLDFITDGVSRMSTLMDDLLKYATLNNPLVFEKVDLNKIVEGVKHNLISLLSRKYGEISAGEMPIICANRSQINQLLQNLICNGLKFNKSENPKVEVTCKEQKDNYLFSISDNGIGIAKEHQEKIWTLFQRLQSRDQFEGSGIGLSVAQKVVTNHQGTIWMESEANQGTTFYFTISKKLGLPSKDVSELRNEVIIETVRN